MIGNLNVAVVGVGGQGNVLLSRILGETALKVGIKVRISDTFGAAQRGAAVLSLVRFGSSYSPVIPLGKADALVALEPSEALRQSRFLRPNGYALINTRRILPVEVLTGKAAYPSTDKISGLLAALTSNLYMFDAAKLAEQAGDSRTTNMVMLGALDGCDCLPFETEAIKETIMDLVPEKMLDSNIKSFELGRSYLQNHRKMEPDLGIALL